MERIGEHKQPVRFPRNSHLGGVLAGRKPSSPFVPKGVEGEAHQSLVKYASMMGIICEQAISQIWSGSLAKISESDREGLLANYGRVHETFSPIFKKTRRHMEVLEAYKPFAEKENKPDPWDIRRYPANPDLKYLTETVDRIFGLELVKKFDEVIDSYGPKPEFRYYFEAVLMLTKELLSPTKFMSKDWRLFSDINLTSKEGGFLRQIDAIALKRKDAPRGKKELDFWQIMKEGKPWMEIEMKCLFEAALNTGKNKLKNPISWHLNQSQDKIARLALEWRKRSRKNFVFPVYLAIVYVRPLQPNKIHYVPLNSEFFRNWGQVLDIKLEAGEIQNGDTQTLREILGRAEKRAFFEEKRASLESKRRVKKIFKASQKFRQKKLRI